MEQVGKSLYDVGHGIKVEISSELFTEIFEIIMLHQFSKGPSDPVNIQLMKLFEEIDNDTLDTDHVKKFKKKRAKKKVESINYPLKEWIEERFGFDSKSSQYWAVTDTGMYFLNAEDAIEFKLRWC